MFVIFANSSGLSEVVNPLGEVVALSGRGTEILTAEIDLRERLNVIAAMNLLADRNLHVD